MLALMMMKAHLGVTTLKVWNSTADPSGPGDEEMAEIEEQEDRESTNRKGKALGLPELDPDALPSSMAQKYLNLFSTERFLYSMKFFLVVGNHPTW